MLETNWVPCILKLAHSQGYHFSSFRFSFFCLYFSTSLSSSLSFGQQFFFLLSLAPFPFLFGWQSSLFSLYYFPLLFTCSVGRSKWRHWAALPFYRHTKRTINPSYIKIRDERGQSVSMCGVVASGWGISRSTFPKKLFICFPSFSVHTYSIHIMREYRRCLVKNPSFFSFSTLHLAFLFLLLFPPF